MNEWYYLLEFKLSLVAVEWANKIYVHILIFTFITGLCPLSLSLSFSFSFFALLKTQTESLSVCHPIQMNKV